MRSGGSITSRLGTMLGEWESPTILSAFWMTAAPLILFHLESSTSMNAGQGNRALSGRPTTQSHTSTAIRSTCGSDSILLTSQHGILNKPVGPFLRAGMEGADVSDGVCRLWPLSRYRLTGSETTNGSPFLTSASSSLRPGAAPSLARIPQVLGRFLLLLLVMER